MKIIIAEEHILLKYYAAAMTLVIYVPHGNMSEVNAMARSYYALKAKELPQLFWYTFHKQNVLWEVQIGH